MSDIMDERKGGGERERDRDTDRQTDRQTEKERSPKCVSIFENQVKCMGTKVPRITPLRELLPHLGQLLEQAR